jgi:hypothetical protein
MVYLKLRLSRIHKISLTFVLVAFLNNLYATDLKVYPNALAPDFASIQDAVDAAVDGDNIYIDTVTFLGNVSIDSKAISLYPMRDEGMYTINGSLTISIENNETVYIQGLSGGSCSVNYVGSSTSTSLEYTRKIIFNGCYFSSNVTVSNYVMSEIYYSEFNSDLDIYDCELIGNSFDTVNIFSGSSIGETKIYANKFEIASATDMLKVSTNRNVHIANNYFNQLNTTSNIYNDNLIDYYASGNEIELLLENNTFKIANQTVSSSYSGADTYHRAYKFSNGIVTVRNNYMNFRQYTGYSQYAQGIYCSGVAVYSFTNNIVSLYSYADIATLESGGFMGIGTIQTIENNYYQLPTISTDPETLGYITSVSNLGSTSADCRDIDNTVNDIGTYGGPHSWENYHSSSVSKAQILDLEIPYYQVILPGVELQFNSKAIHKN